MTRSAPDSPAPCAECGGPRFVLADKSGRPLCYACYVRLDPDRTAGRLAQHPGDGPPPSGPPALDTRMVVCRRKPAARPAPGASPTPQESADVERLI